MDTEHTIPQGGPNAGGPTDAHYAAEFGPMWLRVVNALTIETSQFGPLLRKWVAEADVEEGWSLIAWDCRNDEL